MHTAVLTSYTDDYPLGRLTAPVNRAYAERHGYDFVERVRPAWDPAGSARQPMWDKVSLLLELLRGLLLHRAGAPDAPPLPCSPTTTHLLWVDADAVVLQHDVRVEDLVERHMPPGIMLLIGEDVTPACLVNTGVLLVCVSDWSLQLWADVWSAESSVRFYTRQYHEQSALALQLATRGEGLDAAAPAAKRSGRAGDDAGPPPFHSYLGGGRDPKLFAHVCVMPRHAWNTNRGDVRTATGAAAEARRELGDARCEFVFHAAGQPVIVEGDPPAPLTLRKPSKRAALLAMLEHTGLAHLVEREDEHARQARERARAVRRARLELEYGTLFRKFAYWRAIRGDG